MGKVSTIGLDLAKNVFQAHGADASPSQPEDRRRTSSFPADLSSPLDCMTIDAQKRLDAGDGDR
jgi:hypothetical protein